MDSTADFQAAPRAGRGPVLLCAVLLVLITGLRLAVDNPIEAVGFLYVIPISFLASELGLRGGLIAATGAIVLTIFWVIVQDVPLGVVGYAARAATFGGIGVFVGLQSQRRIKLQHERERLIVKLEATAMRDHLTGLPNRRAWDDRLERELSRAERSRKPLRVVVIDLDKLKHVNDTNGHCCSAGIATWNGNEAGYELVHRADQVMYAVKRGGGGDLAIAPTPHAMPLVVGEGLIAT